VRTRSSVFIIDSFCRCAISARIALMSGNGILSSQSAGMFSRGGWIYYESASAMARQREAT
jgi:hypothetical protein